MYELMNCRNKFHLYYLIVNDIKGEKYNGLSHVAEHTLLFSSEQILQFWGKGYTFLNHVCRLLIRLTEFPILKKQWLELAPVNALAEVLIKK